MPVNPFKPSMTAPTALRPVAPAGEDPMMDFRARLVHQQAEAAERRRHDLAEQSSRLKTAEERIRIWERIHEVTLPRDSAHRLVEIIAANTGLTDADVREEQRRRAEVRSIASAASAATTGTASTAPAITASTNVIAAAV
jgi:hypothetical protein